MPIEDLGSSYPPAILVLSNGVVFSGHSIAAWGSAVGEVVFNTSMTGYQEILTDPSYAEQLVSLTYPQIGNVGVNAADEESQRVWAAGLIIREYSPVVSNWRAEASLGDYLRQHQVVAIAGIDTRRLTRMIREQGALSACLMAGEVDVDKALAAAKAYSGMQGRDLTSVVSTSKVVDGCVEDAAQTQCCHVVVYDFGVKRCILQSLAQRGCRVTVVPAQTSADAVLRLNPDGVVLSNGPGDPAACDYAISNIRALLDEDVPVLGICLGFQLLALACGAKTVKMKFGHHGANHPVEALQTHRVFITSQNHGFAVDMESLPGSLSPTHRSLFDGTLQGFMHARKPVFAFQGHPEASPGPHDSQILFDQFFEAIQCQNAKI